MEDSIAVAGVVIAVVAAVIATFAAVSARRQALATEQQATIAGEQAIIAGEQAESAREQVQAAKAQVVEARRANDLLEAELTERRARDAVKWEARTQRDGTVFVWNRGNETAYNVKVQVGGAEEDWQYRHPSHSDTEEVRAGDYVRFEKRGGLPSQLYIDWDGARHPASVEVVPY